jgi:hypothetical protein
LQSLRKFVGNNTIKIKNLQDSEINKETYNFGFNFFLDFEVLNSAEINQILTASNDFMDPAIKKRNQVRLEDLKQWERN